MKTVSLIGPYIPGIKGCRMTLWSDIEGNASLNIKIMDTKTGIFYSQKMIYPATNRFAYERQIINFNIYYNVDLYRIYLEGNSD